MSEHARSHQSGFGKRGNGHDSHDSHRSFGRGGHGNRGRRDDNPFSRGGARNTSRHFDHGHSGYGPSDRDERNSLRDSGRGSSFHHDGRRGDWHSDDDRRDNRGQRDSRRDGLRGGQRRGSQQRGGFSNQRDNGNHSDSHRDEQRNSRREQHGSRHGGRPGVRGFRDSRRDDRHDGRPSNRRSRHFDRRERFNDVEGNRHFETGPRRNSDGTISFPSQNPYTNRRPGEPKMPQGMEWRMLSSDDKLRLRGLSKEHAENIGLHILAAYALEESDPDAALAHARWAARQASRVDIARETLALVAYRRGDYKLANREFRTAYRMNGEPDYLPFIADCERGLGHPQEAVSIALSPEAKKLAGESKAEMMLVFAGAYADMGKFDQALKIVRALLSVRGLDGAYRMRALQAEQNFLDQAGRGDEAQELEAAIEDLEDEFADPDEDGMDVDDDLVDNDLEEADARMLEGLGIDLSQFAEDKSDENQEIEAGEGGTAESEAAEDAAEAESDNSAAKTAESDGNAGSKQTAASEE